MDKDVKMRVKIAMESLGISAYSIAKSCSINERTIYEQTNGSSRIGVSAVAALLSVSTDLSAEWLLRGEGSMLISSVDPTERRPRDDRETTEQIVDANKMVLAQQKNIEQLEYIIELQKHRIAQLERECEDLKKANSSVTAAHVPTA